jgi:ribosomal protein S18 acetylase RimI-like enzyme
LSLPRHGAEDRPTDVITVRLLNESDVSAYRALRLEALQNSPTAFGSSYGEELLLPLSAFASRLRDAKVFGAYSEEKLIGILGFIRESRAKRAHAASLVGMHVSSSFRRQGVGGALLDHAIQFTRQLGGIKTIKLSVTANNQDAVRLYLSRGFKSYGLEPDAINVGEEYLDEEYLILQIED